VNAALEIVDRVGIDALTIRAVAGLVGAPPMSLYTHFANKEELLDLMFGEVSRRLYADAGHDRWQAELSSLAHHYRRTLLEHPRWTPLLSRPAPPTSSAVRERILKLMVDAGMPADEALRGLSAVIVAAMGLVLVELTFREPDGASSFARRFERIRSMFDAEAEPGSAPTSRVAFAKVRHFDFDETFRVTVDSLIDGLVATRLSPQSR